MDNKEMKDSDMYKADEIKGQTQEKPGREFKMEPEPIYDNKLIWDMAD